MKSTTVRVVAGVVLALAAVVAAAATIVASPADDRSYEFLELANGLKVVGDGLILASQAHLVASLTADWSATSRAALATLMDNFQGDEPAAALMRLNQKIGSHA